MAKVHTLSIANFRGIKKFEQRFDPSFNCIIGRGNSGKSTILEAISFALSPYWNLSLFDSDFTHGNTDEPIIIEVTLTDFPEEFLNESKFQMFQRGITQGNEITDELDQIETSALTIRLKIEKDLEPRWNVITKRDDSEREISANDRGKLNTFLIGDYLERHLTWAKGSPLYSLITDLENKEGNAMLEPLREAKSKIDTIQFTKFDSAVKAIKDAATVFGLDISNTRNGLDFKELLVREGKISLHEDLIPFRLKGKGTKRILSMAMQFSLSQQGGIILVDEIEQGLEPDRVQHIVNKLKIESNGQVFITTHSRDAVVELTAKNLLLMREGAKCLTSFSQDLQGLIRANPEAFFAKKIFVCEGLTEIGFIKSLNKLAVSRGSSNMAYVGLRLADGKGSNLFEYSSGFKESGFQVALFCDSDLDKNGKKINPKKQQLKEIGVKVIDWEEPDNFEIAICKYVPFPLLKEILTLGIKNEALEKNIEEDEVKINVYSSIEDYLKNKSVNFNVENDSKELRNAIARRAANESWFKNMDKAQELGKLIVDKLSTIPKSRLTENIDEIIKWIYGGL